MSESQSSQSQSLSRGFAFSDLFQSSSLASPAAAPVRHTPSQQSGRSILREQTAASFIGFSWGPTVQALKPNEATGQHGSTTRQETINTPRPIRHTSVPLTPYTFVPLTPGPGSIKIAATPRPASQLHPFATPIRPNIMSPYGTLPRASTIRRTAPRRAVSDREAMKQLVDCVGMSARKKVLESGRKPRILNKFNFGSGSKSGSTLKELRFDRSVMVMNDTGISFKVDPGPASASTSASGSMLLMSVAGSAASGASSVMNASQSNHSQSHSQSQSHSLSLLSRVSRDNNTSFFVPSEESDTSTETDIPPSPSPSPRPGSAMSMLSRRSQTPTITSSYMLRSNGTLGSRSGDTMKSNFLSPLSPVDPVWRMDGSNIPNRSPEDDDGGEGRFPMDVVEEVRDVPEVARPEVRSRKPMEQRPVVSKKETEREDDPWEGLQLRHVKLMRDIAGLDGRITDVALHIRGLS